MEAICEEYLQSVRSMRKGDIAQEETEGNQLGRCRVKYIPN